ncbi:hypothetical protein N7510_000196 [Penicillium lagena]|uniref:uncharacterized protein n=1 Tax=Penicillium lagena TaxID=94218 RepID=UPI00253FA9F0|nr:uncharacterized protein N7510_000196 [Penicillium lagena]KAJ5623887.1 hypothetical protein N7510_000196 [Penicillium lagena]
MCDEDAVFQIGGKCWRRLTSSTMSGERVQSRRQLSTPDYLHRSLASSYAEATTSHKMGETLDDGHSLGRKLERDRQESVMAQWPAKSLEKRRWSVICG